MVVVFVDGRPISVIAGSTVLQDIVDLMNLSMLQTQSDVFGGLDFERSQHGSGSSLRTLQKQVLQLILREKRETGNDIISLDRIKTLAKNCPQVRMLLTL